MNVKICGLKTKETARTALEAGADFIGLVFFPKSPRHVTIEQAAELSCFCKEHSPSAKVVALVVNPVDEDLKTIINEVQPDYIQLHGSETPERVSDIAKKFHTPLIKAIGVKDSDDAAKADDYTVADIILFDAKADPKLTSLPGGNGIPFDWEALKGQKEKRRFMLSGGLTVDNVGAAIKLTGASIVDVSSGVESSAGVKDNNLIEAFIRASKNKGEG